MKVVIELVKGNYKVCVYESYLDEIGMLSKVINILVWNL